LKISYSYEVVRYEMEHEKQITHDIIKKLLLDTFPKNNFLDNCSSTRLYKKIKHKSTTIPLRPFTSTFKKQTNTLRKIINYKISMKQLVNYKQYHSYVEAI